jgi:GNAT superfamily N-acetyltransferase
MTVGVRLATADDVEAVCRICEAGYRFVTEPLLPKGLVDEKVAEFYDPVRVAGEVDPTRLTRHWQGYLVAERDGRVVGAAGGGLVAEDVGQLYVLYLALDHRRTGLGTALLDAVTRQHVDLGATRQRVAVLADNPHGVPFYLARGFREVERRAYPPGAPQPVTELVLERSLAGPAGHRSQVSP